MLQAPCFTCINGIYVAVYGHMNMIFTQDTQAAQEIARSMGNTQEPYWWIEQTPVTAQTYPVIVQTIQEIYRLLGQGGLDEFVSFRAYDFSEKYTGQAGVFSLKGFVF